MKRVISFILIMTMITTLFTGCAGGQSSTVQTTQDETVAETDVEESKQQEEAEQSEAELIRAALDQGWIQEPTNGNLSEIITWIPKSVSEDLKKTITWKEMTSMLATMIYQCNPELLPEWVEVASKALEMDDTMERDEGMLAIYEAACVLGIGHEGRGNWHQVDRYHDAQGIWKTDFGLEADGFTNVYDVSPFEPNPGWPAEWDYRVGARFYSLGHSSVANLEPFFSYVKRDYTFSSNLSCKEAINAVAKLRLAYLVQFSGGYKIAETDWSDHLLADASKAREAILNSPTTIQKGEELVLGETYTGTAYYVSEDGNDNNDGLTPETAWATLTKVEYTPLEYGDTVFFNRGDSWYGQLVMQAGVTYSAYGEGAKPIITGSLSDMAQSEKWILHEETADGRKIWKYAESVGNSGVLLLNGGEIVARKEYPLWDGEQYTTAKGEVYDVTRDLADLSYFPAIDLTGQSLPVFVEDNSFSGTLYMRCDAGNPGEIYSQIELAVLDSGTSTALEGYNAIDNIHFRCYAGMGMDCCSHDNIVYQNCESSWCGGGISRYDKSIYQHNPSAVHISGGGLLLFGSNVTGHNNYIHDCENKGVAVVINGGYGLNNKSHASIERVNVLAEGNVIERCGSSFYMMIEFMAPGSVWKFEDVRFMNNYVVNGGYGWRQMNQLDLEEKGVSAIVVNNVRATGEVLFENNLFYRSAGSLVYANAPESDEGAGAIFPTFRGNTYVQDRGQILFDNTMPTWKDGAGTTLLTENQAVAEECVREFLGDATGEIVILEPLNPLVTIEAMPTTNMTVTVDEVVDMMNELIVTEAEQAQKLGFVPEEILTDGSKTITYKQMCTMIGNMLSLLDSEASTHWADEVAVKAITGTRSMTRGEGAGALFQAAKLIGQADITQDWERICWTRHDEAGEGFWRGWNQELILANFPSAAEPTTFDGQAKDNSCWPAMVWSMGKSSPVSMKTILDYDETYKSPLFGEPLTCEDAICAVLRLYETAAESQE